MAHPGETAAGITKGNSATPDREGFPDPGRGSQREDGDSNRAGRSDHEGGVAMFGDDRFDGGEVRDQQTAEL
jgi:hypothetical protein